MSNIARIKGHRLEAEGAAYMVPPTAMAPVLGKQLARVQYNTTRGAGRALCECGEYSEELPSAGARKMWHYRHKSQIIADRGW